jgi:hypothetical protein
MPSYDNFYYTATAPAPAGSVNPSQSHRFLRGDLTTPADIVCGNINASDVIINNDGIVMKNRANIFGIINAGNTTSMNRDSLILWKGAEEGILTLVGRKDDNSDYSWPGIKLNGKTSSITANSATIPTISGNTTVNGSMNISYSQNGSQFANNIPIIGNTVCSINRVCFVGAGNDNTKGVLIGTDNSGNLAISNGNGNSSGNTGGIITGGKITASSATIPTISGNTTVAGTLTSSGATVNGNTYLNGNCYGNYYFGGGNENSDVNIGFPGYSAGLNVIRNATIGGNLTVSNGSTISTTGLGSFGSLKIGNTTITEDRLKMLIDGNTISTTGVGSFGSIQIGNTTITEDHLKILTGQKRIQIFTNFNSYRIQAITAFQQGLSIGVNATNGNPDNLSSAPFSSTTYFYLAS